MSTNEAAVDVPASDSMPNTPAQAEPARENHGAEEKQEMTIEDYKSALEKVRREAAKYRTGNKELRPLAQRAKEAEEAGKSELQKAHMAQLGLEVAPARIQGYGPHATYDALARAAGFGEKPSNIILELVDDETKELIKKSVPAFAFPNHPRVIEQVSARLTRTLMRHTLNAGRISSRRRRTARQSPQQAAWREAIWEDRRPVDNHWNRWRQYVSTEELNYHDFSPFERGSAPPKLGNVSKKGTKRVVKSALARANPSGDEDNCVRCANWGATL